MPAIMVTKGTRHACNISYVGSHNHGPYIMGNNLWTKFYIAMCWNRFFARWRPLRPGSFHRKSCSENPISIVRQSKRMRDFYGARWISVKNYLVTILDFPRCLTWVEFHSGTSTNRTCSRALSTLFRNYFEFGIIFFSFCLHISYSDHLGQNLAARCSKI